MALYNNIGKASAAGKAGSTAIPKKKMKKELKNKPTPVEQEPVGRDGKPLSPEVKAKMEQIKAQKMAEQIYAAPGTSLAPKGTKLRAEQDAYARKKQTMTPEPSEGTRERYIQELKNELEGGDSSFKTKDYSKLKGKFNNI